LGGEQSLQTKSNCTMRCAKLGGRPTH
jgi:hypothetical protein